MGLAKPGARNGAVGVERKARRHENQKKKKKKWPPTKQSVVSTRKGWE
jgi:hypothetical protein